MKKTILTAALVLAGYASPSLAHVTKICSTDATDPHYLKSTTTFGQTADESFTQIQICALGTDDCQRIGKSTSYWINDILFEEKNALVIEFKEVLLNESNGASCTSYSLTQPLKMENVARQLGQALDQIQKATKKASQTKKLPLFYRDNKTQIM